MAFRKRSNSRGDKRHFSRSAMRVHRRNVNDRPMRGGIRL